MGKKFPRYVQVQKGLQTGSFKSTWLPDVNVCMYVLYLDLLSTDTFLNEKWHVKTCYGDRKTWNMGSTVLTACA